MAAGAYDITSLTEDEFKNLLQSKLRDAKEIKLTLRKADEKKSEQKEIRLGCFQKEMKAGDLPLALVFCKDKSNILPKSFPMEHYDIIEKVRN